MLLCILSGSEAKEAICRAATERRPCTLGINDLLQRTLRSWKGRGVCDRPLNAQTVGDVGS